MSELMAFIRLHGRRLVVLSVVTVMAVIMMQRDGSSQEVASYVPIENISIEGKFENLLQSDIKETVQSVMKGGFFTVDIEVIREALLELAWVEDISIRREWPAGLSISVEEKRAIAYWGDDRLLSDRGEVFKPAAISREQSIPRLSGPDSQHRKVWVFLKETNQKVEDLGMKVQRLALDKRRSWEMQFSNGVIVRLGREDTENRMRRFIKVFAMDRAPKMEAIESIDLRYPNGFAVQMKTTEPDLTKDALVKEV